MSVVKIGVTTNCHAIIKKLCGVMFDSFEVKVENYSGSIQAPLV